MTAGSFVVLTNSIAYIFFTSASLFTLLLSDRLRFAQVVESLIVY